MAVSPVIDGDATMTCEFVLQFVPQSTTMSSPYWPSASATGPWPVAAISAEPARSASTDCWPEPLTVSSSTSMGAASK